MTPDAAAAPKRPSLAPGTRLGAYAIEAAIGAGGMGEVYRARDTRLDRSVAIKVLPPEVASDPSRRHRFEREARAVAALEHPHICVLHDIGSENGVDFLVMELLDGQTLAQRLKKGRIPRDEALRIGIEVADALDAAHRQGITHRDLKPANVMLTKAGVKLLDFGLAKLRPVGPADGLKTATTAEPTSTETGVILGTLPYMAPEQVGGREADARSDLWALGVVLYEMLSGRRAFVGASAASLIASILEHEPEPLSALDELTPPALDRTVCRCLAKDPDARWQSARDVSDELSWISQGGGASAGVGEGARWGRGVWVAWAAVGAALLGLGVTLGIELKGGPAPGAGPVLRTLLSLTPATGLLGGWSPGSVGRVGILTELALSPDGRALAFVGFEEGAEGPIASGFEEGLRKRQLYLRWLGEPHAAAIAGTDGAEGPFFSPDGAWIGFWARRQLWKVALRGGPPVSLCTLARPPHGASWGASGRIVLGQEEGGLLQLPQTGGDPTPLTRLAPGEHSHRLPHVLPEGDAVIFTVLSARWVWTDARIVVQSLRNGARTLLVEGGADARYVPTGHLVFLRLGSLMAVPFDAEDLETRGPVVGLVEGIEQAVYLDNEDWETGAGQYSVSPSGALAFVDRAPPQLPEFTLVRVNHRGAQSPLAVPVRDYLYLRVAPDGRHVAVSIRQEEGFVLWLADLERGTLARLGPGEFPVWAPKGRDLAFALEGKGLFRRPGEAPGPTVRLLEDRAYCAPASWTRDGSRLAFVRREPLPGGGGQTDIRWLDAGGPQKEAQPLVASRFSETDPEFSPDGHWLAYTSEETGRPEVYIQAHPAGTPRVQVSREQGANPAWSPDGRELYYINWFRQNPQKRFALVAVTVATSPRLAIGPPRVLFEFANGRLAMGCAETRCYDVLPDGSGFVAAYLPEPRTTPAVDHINLVLNWTEELKARAPAVR